MCKDDVKLEEVQTRIILILSVTTSLEDSAAEVFSVSSVWQEE